MTGLLKIYGFCFWFARIRFYLRGTWKMSATSAGFLVNWKEEKRPGDTVPTTGVRSRVFWYTLHGEIGDISTQEFTVISVYNRTKDTENKRTNPDSLEGWKDTPDLHLAPFQPYLLFTLSQCGLRCVCVLFFPHTSWETNLGKVRFSQTVRLFSVSSKVASVVHSFC